MNPFDWRAFLLARHAQHVALIHFPIALFIIGVVFDLAGVWRRREEFALVAYYNFCVAAISTVPALLTGLIAWQWALEGRRLKGTLLLHLLCAAGSVLIIWCVWFLARRARRQGIPRGSSLWKFGLEFLGVGLLAVTGHLGGFLSGVNGGP
ncbi:MAG TPA: DUF2231 domain-containing protein [Candidatus Acidoferrum sp.]|nr:DUF2231 domain-containing protein [Candidatus Acidoferrum sp.]